MKKQTTPPGTPRKRPVPSNIGNSDVISPICGSPNHYTNRASFNSVTSTISLAPGPATYIKQAFRQGFEPAAYQTLKDDINTILYSQLLAVLKYELALRVKFPQKIDIHWPWFGFRRQYLKNKINRLLREYFLSRPVGSGPLDENSLKRLLNQLSFDHELAREAASILGFLFAKTRYNTMTIITITQLNQLFKEYTNKFVEGSFVVARFSVLRQVLLPEQGQDLVQEIKAASEQVEQQQNLLITHMVPIMRLLPNSDVIPNNLSSQLIANNPQSYTTKNGVDLLDSSMYSSATSATVQTMDNLPGLNLVSIYADAILQLLQSFGCAIEDTSDQTEDTMDVGQQNKPKGLTGQLTKQVTKEVVKEGRKLFKPIIDALSSSTKPIDPYVAAIESLVRSVQSNECSTVSTQSTHYQMAKALRNFYDRKIDGQLTNQQFIALKQMMMYVSFFEDDDLGQYKSAMRLFNKTLLKQYARGEKTIQKFHRVMSGKSGVPSAAVIDQIKNEKTLYQQIFYFVQSIWGNAQGQIQLVNQSSLISRDEYYQCFLQAVQSDQNLSFSKKYLLIYLSFAIRCGDDNGAHSIKQVVTEALNQDGQYLYDRLLQCEAIPHYIKLFLCVWLGSFQLNPSILDSFFALPAANQPILASKRDNVVSQNTALALEQMSVNEIKLYATSIAVMVFFNDKDKLKKLDEHINSAFSSSYNTSSSKSLKFLLAMLQWYQACKLPAPELATNNRESNNFSTPIANGSVKSTGSRSSFGSALSSGAKNLKQKFKSREQREIKLSASASLDEVIKQLQSYLRAERLDDQIIQPPLVKLLDLYGGSQHGKAWLVLLPYLALDYPGGDNFKLSSLYQARQATLENSGQDPNASFTSPSGQIKEDNRPEYQLPVVSASKSNSQLLSGFYDSNKTPSRQSPNPNPNPNNLLRTPLIEKSGDGRRRSNYKW